MTEKDVCECGMIITGINKNHVKANFRMHRIGKKHKKFMKMKKKERVKVWFFRSLLGSGNSLKRKEIKQKAKMECQDNLINLLKRMIKIIRLLELGYNSQEIFYAMTNYREDFSKKILNVFGESKWLRKER